MFNESEFKARLDIRKACYVDPIYHIVKVRVNANETSGVSIVRNVVDKVCHKIEWSTTYNKKVAFTSIEEIPYQ